MPTATREGYTFTGWATNINAILGEYKTNYEIQDNITLYAIWTSDKYTITFNGNGGIVETETISANFNSDIILPEATRSGYTLVGWDIRASSATAKYEAGKEYTVQGNITLYAIWKANKFDIILNGNGGAFVYGNGNKIEQISYQKYASDTITMPIQENTNGYPVIQKNGYTFKGWATEAGSDVVKYQPGKTYSVSDIVANSTNLYAIWQINKYTITFNRNSSDNSIKINGESTENYHITENYLENVALPAATRNGYTLLGWSENPTDTTVDASGTVGTTVTITVNKAESKSGTVTVNVKSITGGYDSSDTDLTDTDKKAKIDIKVDGTSVYTQSNVDKNSTAISTSFSGKGKVQIVVNIQDGNGASYTRTTELDLSKQTTYTAQ